MGFGDFNFSGRGGGVEISPHAQKRWAKRAATDRGLEPRVWMNAEPVVAPEVDGDEVRLTEIRGGQDILLVGHLNKSGMVISTVLFANKDELG